jgi:sulfoxide reductase heme-binding subunit YedZ
MQLLATATGPHIFWILSRAAGICALVLSSLAVSVGVSIGSRLIKRPSGELRVAHEALTLATLVAVAVHGLALLGDGFLHPTVADIAIPFASGYESAWTSAGIVAFWLMLVLGLSYYARAKIGVGRWRSLHRLTAVAWLLALGHSLGEGTDAGQQWFLAMTAVVALPALALLALRWGQRAIALDGRAASPGRAAASDPSAPVRSAPPRARRSPQPAGEVR